MLAVAVSRILNAGYILNRMREMQRQGNDAEYWRLHGYLNEHLTIGGHAVMDANWIMLAAEQIAVPVKGGLLN